MLRRDKKLFCYFSGYTHEDVKLNDFNINYKTSTFSVHCENIGSYKLSIGEPIQLNGLLFEVTSTTSNQSFSASTTRKLLSLTAFNYQHSSKKLSLGILAEFDEVHNQMWALQPSACGTVTYKGYSTFADHQYTLKLDFEADKKFADIIHDNQHLGLAGSSLTAREVRKNGNLVKFSIYAGLETRENTQFNADLPLDTLVNLTEAASIISFK